MFYYIFIMICEVAYNEGDINFLNLESVMFSLRVSIEKTNIMFNRHTSIDDVKIDGKRLTAIKKVMYVGIKNNNDGMQEIIN